MTVKALFNVFLFQLPNLHPYSAAGGASAGGAGAAAGFSAEDKATLESFCAQVGIAMENASLYDRLADVPDVSVRSRGRDYCVPSESLA